jgi:hypothetical protein
MHFLVSPSALVEGDGSHGMGRLPAIDRATPAYRRVARWVRKWRPMRTEVTPASTA